MAPRVLLSGSIAGHPIGYGGNTWAFLQWVLGFRRLGFEVYYVEEHGAGGWIDETFGAAPLSESVNARYFRQVMEHVGIVDHAALLERGTSAHIGLSRDDIDAIAGSVDVFLNQFGSYRAVLGRVRRSIYLDLDPGHTQIWQAKYGIDMQIRDHDLYLTLGLNLGERGCPLPTCGVEWAKTLFPIVLSEWTGDAQAGPAFTTVANWRDYSWVEWDGVWYAQKAEAFKNVIDVPRRASMPIEVCLGIADSDPDLALLRENGWRVVSPRERVPDPESYRRYILGSRGEFSPVRPICSVGQTGWFSDRSGCYLAAGRPVVMEDTGVGRHVPVGQGLLTYTDADTAVACLETVQRDYSRHAAAARSFAREHLDSDRVLGRILALAHV